MKKALYTIAAAAMIAAALTSCSTQKGTQYQQHLKHRHSGAHHISNGNGGCGWNK